MPRKPDGGRAPPRPTGRRLRRLGSDPAAAELRVGLGVTELSCTPAAVHDVKAARRQVDLAACRKLASAALELASPRKVRDLVSASKK